MVILSINEDGIMSNENAFLSGSVLGNIELFNKEELYRSLNPRMMTNLLSWMEVPLTRRNTSLVVLSGDFFITSYEMPSEIAETNTFHSPVAPISVAEPTTRELQPMTSDSGKIA